MTRPGVAAFDFDGTLVPGDSFMPFLLRLRGGPRFAADGLGVLPAAVTGYRAQGRDGAKAALLAATVAGLDAARVAAVGQSCADRLVSRVRPSMTNRLRWHRERNHRLILVSASLTAYLEPFAARMGFDDVVATRLEERDGRLTGRIAGANVRGEEKARRVRELLGGQSVELWAYGDSPGDRELLAMADHPLLVGRRSRRR